VNASDTGARSATHAQLNLPSWQPGEDLTGLEELMQAKAAAGELVDCGEGPFELADMQGWGKERAIRAAVLRYLLVVDAWPVDTRGVWLRGVRIHGHLDIEGVTLRCPLRLEDCYLDAGEPVRLDHATANRLALTGCHLAGLSGESLFAGEVDLGGSALTGPLWMFGADITGQLICRGATLSGTDNNGNAMVGDRMKVGGSVVLDQGFTAAGAIRLAGADITGRLSCRGARLTGHDSDGDALIGDRMKVGGSVVLDQGFTAAGAIRLPDSDITGGLFCSGARLTSHDSEGNAMVGDRMTVRGSVILDQEFTAAGAISLASADITLRLSCRGAALTGKNQDGETLVGDGMTVGGDVFFDHGFIAPGTISLPLTQIGGSVALGPAALAGSGELALDATRAQITGSLVWAPSAQVFGLVNLEDATVGRLVDHWGMDRPGAFWPPAGQLRLDGFTYDRFGGDQQATVRQRLDWIRSQYRRSPTGWLGFVSQPYEQLATVYQRAGQDGSARTAAIAMLGDRRRYGQLSAYRRFGNWMLDKTIKYGYQNWRAGVLMVVAYLIVVVLSVMAQHHGLIEPVGNIQGLRPVPVATQCTANYPCFYPVGYAFDVVVPLINFHQTEFWGINGAAPWGQALTALIWVATALGWIGATFLVTGLTALGSRR
jgi:hypothetical protein